MALIALVATAAFALQPVGSFHAGEPVARDGERWLALQATPAAAALVETRVRVKPVHDVVVDGDGSSTGLEVASAVPGATVLLRGAGLHAGSVEVAALPASHAPLAAAPFDLRLGSTRYRLALQCNGGATRCDVVLDDGRRRQVLFALDAGRQDDGSLMLGDDASPTVLFAGDLDRDGRLDLILDTTDHYNVGRPTLFLSTAAREGELLRPVAVHESVGC
jgi:hypothetical protein